MNVILLYLILIHNDKKIFFIIFYNHFEINTNISKVLILIIIIFLYFIFKIDIISINYRIAYVYTMFIQFWYKKDDIIFYF